MHGSDGMIVLFFILLDLGIPDSILDLGIPDSIFPNCNLNLLFQNLSFRNTIHTCIDCTTFTYTVIQHRYHMGGRRDHDRMVIGFTLTMQSVPITTKVVSSNLARERCTRYNIM